MTLPTKFYRKLALSSHILLIIWMPLWHLLLAEPTGRSQNFEIFLALVWTLPLLFPLPGMLADKPYTFAWANFVVLLNFSHACSCLWLLPAERTLALLELIFALLMLICGSYYAQQQQRKLRQTDSV